MKNDISLQMEESSLKLRRPSGVSRSIKKLSEMIGKKKSSRDREDGKP
jgi:hypothetical protein